LGDPGVHGIMWGSDLRVISPVMLCDSGTAFVSSSSLVRVVDSVVISSVIFNDSGAALVGSCSLVRVVICRVHMGGIDLVQGWV